MGKPICSKNHQIASFSSTIEPARQSIQEAESSWQQAVAPTQKKLEGRVGVEIRLNALTSHYLASASG
jgi:hypothetical protein